ncbi:DUF4249 domain-containing protein [Chitinophaga vietnamensis]|uniref:DUF4249 domain-containing protein n=1 Tax=Chitinophaga vietnamensis TaxID=2593957 RepID=UPI001375487A|nr:DUF4249 domain-containing protein [Chitinophaga vietnamensis]
MRKILLFISFAALAFLTACEDSINLDVPKGQSFPVMDAWITNETGLQKIRFTMSVPYTDQAPAPIINDATITLYDLTSGANYPFTFKNDMYTYDAGNKPIGIIGHAYKLHVAYKGEIFEALDTLRRVPPIDSITFEYKTKDEALSGKEGYYAKFHAKDLSGATDYYWIRSYRNDTTKKVSDVFSIDGTYDEGLSDGASFILPIAQGITDNDHPFLLNETVIVKIFSITHGNYDFLTQVNDQVHAGGLFAKVLENVRSNVLNTTPNGKIKILGRFGTSAVSRAEKTAK